MAHMQSMTQASLAEAVGALELGTLTVPYIDLRFTEAREPLYDTAHQVMRNLPEQRLGPLGLRLLVLALPQPSDRLALVLAREGIQLFVGSNTEPTSALLDRFREHLRLIGALRASHSTTGTSAAGTSTRGPSGSAGVFTQRPPWFDQKAFEDRMRPLQQPWRDEDSWTSES
jgi:hypothetical protein